jgi:hypothetical protein
MVDERFVVALRGDLKRIMAAEKRAAREAAIKGASDAAKGLQSAWRREIVEAGLGERMSKSIRVGEPDLSRGGVSVRVFARGSSNALRPHTEGAIIVGKDGGGLAIPLPAAGKAEGGRRITPALWEQKTGLKLRMIQRGAGKAPLLVADLRARQGARGAGKFATPSASTLRTGRGLASVILFVLQRRVELRRRVQGWGRHVKAWRRRLPALVLSAWPDDTDGSAS